MEITFKKLTDLVEILSAYEVYKPCMYMPTKEKYERKVKAWLQDENIKIYACMEAADIRGIIAILLQSPHKAEIVGISVDLCSRGQGIGSYMIQKIMEKHDVDELFAETDDDAVMFYKKFGFKVTEVAKNYDGQTVVRYNCVLM